MTSISTHLFVTGATGFIGRHFVYRVLRDRPDTQLTLLVRGDAVTTALNRVVALLCEVARDYGDEFEASALLNRIRIFTGDVAREHCGLDADEIKRVGLPVPTEFWHLAATLQFETSNRDTIEELNVNGTTHALDLAKALGCKRFVQVSTAYACGAVAGWIPETLHPQNTAFNNEYERSKCSGEHIAMQRGAELNLDVRILRPSVVVGLSQSHATSGSQTGLYGFARELLRLQRVLKKQAAPTRIEGDPEAEVNLIPVDALVEDMLFLQQSGFPQGPIYHLTSLESPTVKQMLDATCDGLDLPHLSIVRELPEDASPLERATKQRMQFYGCYLRNDKRFVRSTRGAVSMTGADVEQYARTYLSTRGRRTDSPDPQRILARDGFPLMVSRTPLTLMHRQSVILVNALGMPRGTLTKLGKVLAAQYSVVTWESRGVPSLDGDLNDTTAQFSRHLDDLHDVLAHYSIDRAHLVGWCTGADLALEFARREPERVQSVVCLNGSFVGYSKARLPFQDNLEKIVRRVVSSPLHAQSYFSLMAQSLLHPGTQPTVTDAEAQQRVNMAMAHLDPALLPLVSAPLSSAQHLRRYCQLLAHYLAEAPRSLTDLPIPSLLTTSEDDTIAHPDATRVVANRLPHCRLRVAPQGGHFAPCVDEELFETVLAFLRTVSAVHVDWRTRLEKCA